MKKKYIVRLSEQERATCQEVVKKLKGNSQKVMRAQILLKADANGPSWIDEKIAEAFGCRRRTVEGLRERLVREGFELALEGKRPINPPRAKLLSGEQEAELIAMRLGSPPAGYGSWTLKLLQSEMIALEIVDSISHETIRKTLKKNGLTRKKIQYWVIPPESDSEFVAGMEDVLEVYSRPYNPNLPVICMDEQPIQLIEETRAPIPATKSHPQRVDYEYERAGRATIFMFAEPLAGKREIRVRAQRTKIDWAIEVERLLNTKYVGIEKIILVCDNLNTHTRGAFYEAFPAEKARQIVKRIEFHYTPKHGSWLNIAECELSAMTSQYLKNRRIGKIEYLIEETQAWAKKTNQTQRGVNWQFSIEKARYKLKSIYPKIEY